MTNHRRTTRIVTALALGVFSTATLGAQGPGSKPPTPPKPGSSAATVPAPVSTAPPDYIIGVEDVLAIEVWKDKDLRADPAVVRPDGKVSFPLINEIAAVGLTPEQLRLNITAALVAGKFVEDPTVSVVVRSINSRQVFIQGNVAKPGPYKIVGAMTLAQLITVAGGLLEFADKEHIVIISGSQKMPNGQPMSWEINYKDVENRKNLSKNNPELKPNDQVIVK
jgi:polysaccharide export outer membrane protein